MAASSYQLIFDGKLADGFSRDEVHQNLCRLFKLSDRQADRLLQGGDLVVKRDLDAPTATQYRAAFLKAGALVELRRVSPPPNDGENTSSPVDESRPSRPAPQRVEATAASMQLLPPGALITDANEPDPAPPDTSHLSLTSGEDMTLSDCAPPDPEPPALDLDRYALEPLDAKPAADGGPT